MEQDRDDSTVATPNKNADPNHLCGASFKTLRPIHHPAVVEKLGSQGGVEAVRVDPIALARAIDEPIWYWRAWSPHRLVQSPLYHQNHLARQGKLLGIMCSNSSRPKGLTPMRRNTPSGEMSRFRTVALLKWHATPHCPGPNGGSIPSGLLPRGHRSSTP